MSILGGFYFLPFSFVFLLGRFLSVFTSIQPNPKATPHFCIFIDFRSPLPYILCFFFLLSLSFTFHFSIVAIIMSLNFSRGTTTVVVLIVLSSTAYKLLGTVVEPVSDGNLGIPEAY